MSRDFQPFKADAAKTIASYHPTHPRMRPDLEIAQAQHRIELVTHWRIPVGSRILEIGAGQGTMTAVLAECVGPEGSIDALDPGKPDYGSPFTLAQAQGHLSDSPVGDRIRWRHAHALDFLKSYPDRKWDLVVFAHSIWYFDSPEVLGEMLVALRGRAETVLIAEYSLRATEKEAIPHVLAAMTRASLEAHNPSSEANIRCLLSPRTITELASESGWTMQYDTTMVPGPGLLDGSWEVGDIKSSAFVKDIDKHVRLPRVRVLLKASRDAVLDSLDQIGDTRVRSMDVWAASFGDSDIATRFI